MKIRLYLFINIFLLVSTLELEAHCDFFVKQNYGNVSLRIETGFRYEEIRKVMIIAKLAETMCKELNYKDTVFLDFIHFYTNKESSPAYFISFDDGCIRNKYHDEIEYLESDFNHDVLVIRQGAYSFDPVKTLKLLEYSIKNAKKINSEQSQISYDSNYCHFLVFSIDTNLIKKIIQQNNSALIEKLLKTRIDRVTPNNICYSKEEDDFASINYFYQNSKYHIYFDNYRRKRLDSLVFTFDNIYDFRLLDEDNAMVFDTDSTFYFLKNWNRRFVSKKHTIKDSRCSWIPIEIKNLGGNKISLYNRNLLTVISENKSLYRHLLYYTDFDILIQDIDEIIKPETIK